MSYDVGISFYPGHDCRSQCSSRLRFCRESASPLRALDRLGTQRYYVRAEQLRGESPGSLDQKQAKKTLSPVRTMGTTSPSALPKRLRPDRAYQSGSFFRALPALFYMPLNKHEDGENADYKNPVCP
jgi:hypothetical protein